MTIPNVIGLDLSITATGIALCDGTTHTVTNKLAGDARLLAIRHAVNQIPNIDLAVIEDLPTHAKAAGITGMVHGVIRAHLLDRDIPYALMPPASLKKYATGKGNSGKPEMAVAAFKRAGREFADDNQCDAWWLRAAGLDHLDAPFTAMPQTHRAALAAVTWP